MCETNPRRVRTEFAAINNTMPLQADIDRATSKLKSACPGVSMRFNKQSENTQKSLFH